MGFYTGLIDVSKYFITSIRVVRCVMCIVLISAKVVFKNDLNKNRVHFNMFCGFFESIFSAGVNNLIVNYDQVRILYEMSF